MVRIGSGGEIEREMCISLYTFINRISMCVAMWCDVRYDAIQYNEGDNINNGRTCFTLLQATWTHVPCVCVCAFIVYKSKLVIILSVSSNKLNTYEWTWIGIKVHIPPTTTTTNVCVFRNHLWWCVDVKELSSGVCVYAVCVQATLVWCHEA